MTKKIIFASLALAMSFATIGGANAEMTHKKAMMHHDKMMAHHHKMTHHHMMMHKTTTHKAM